MWPFDCTKHRDGGLLEQPVKDPLKLLHEQRARRELADAERTMLIGNRVTELMPEANQFMLDRAEAEHVTQMMGFRVTPKRFGDFLTLSILRPGNPVGRRKHVLSINLSTTPTITVTAGTRANLAGKREVWIDGKDMLPNDVAWKIVMEMKSETYIYAPAVRDFIGFNEPYERHSRYMGLGPTYYDYICQRSKDDMISFGGSADATLLVPNGLADSIHTAIMEEIGAGWEIATTRVTSG